MSDEQWYAVYVSDTGELYSTGTVVAEATILTGLGLTAIEIDGAPDFAVEQWDPEQLALVAIAPAPEPPDALQALRVAHNAVSQALAAHEGRDG